MPLLVGTDTARVVEAVTLLIEDRAALAAMAVPRFPFGDGRSAPRIAAVTLPGSTSAGATSAARSLRKPRGSRPTASRWN